MSDANAGHREIWIAAEIFYIGKIHNEILAYYIH